jgi:nucleotide-binding universal stress UspA family protein
MQQIVVAYDGTEPAKRALERAAELAQAFDAKVIVTSVAWLLHSGPRADQQFELHSPPGSDPEIRRDSLADHESELADATAFFAERGIEAEPVAVSGDPASAIVSLAETRNADLVVVGTREAGLAERVVHHSVSQQVAKKVHCDLLIVHPHH